MCSGVRQAVVAWTGRSFEEVTDRSDMSKSEVILSIGAEGGDMTLYGVRTGETWLFRRKVVDQTLLLMDEPGFEDTTEAVGSLEEGLALLDQHPWHNLYPLEVHPEFRAEVLSAWEARFKADDSRNQHVLDRWKKLCGALDEQSDID